MAFQTTPGLAASGISLGFFRVNARYNVRGRRADVLPTSIRVAMMTEKEQLEAFEYLVKKYRSDQKSGESMIMALKPGIADKLTKR
jgi:hypothetical protein